MRSHRSQEQAVLEGMKAATPRKGPASLRGDKLRGSNIPEIRG